MSETRAEIISINNSKIKTLQQLVSNQPSYANAPLANFLAKPDVRKAMAEYTSEYILRNRLVALDGSHDNTSYISRIFNNVKKPYKRAIPLHEALIEAVTLDVAQNTGEANYTNIWINLAVAYACDDFFDKDGNILQKVAEQLNHNGKLDLLDEIYEDKNIIKCNLIGAYIAELVNYHTLEQVKKINILDKNDPAKAPSYIFSHSQNVTLNKINQVDGAMIEAINNLLADAASDPQFQAPKLKKCIEDRIDYLACMHLINKLGDAFSKLPIPFEKLKMGGESLLTIISTISTDPKPDVSVPMLIKVLLATNRLLESRQDKIKFAFAMIDYRDLAKEIATLTNGEFVARAMLGVAGAVFVVSAGAVAASFFGALSVPAVVVTTGKVIATGGGIGTLASSAVNLARHAPSLFGKRKTKADLAKGMVTFAEDLQETNRTTSNEEVRRPLLQR